MISFHPTPQNTLQHHWLWSILSFWKMQVDMSFRCGRWKAVFRRVTTSWHSQTVSAVLVFITRHIPTRPFLLHFSLLSSGYPVGGAHKMVSEECLNARGDNIETEESSGKCPLSTPETSQAGLVRKPRHRSAKQIVSRCLSRNGCLKNKMAQETEPAKIKADGEANLPVEWKAHS